MAIGSSASMEEPFFFQPMLLMPVYYSYTSQSSPMPTMDETTIEPKFSEQPSPEGPTASSDSSTSSSWHDDLYATLDHIYENKRKWIYVEDGLCLRSNALPLIDQLYVEDDSGDYHPWGNAHEFASLADELATDYSGVAHINAESMTVRVYFQKQETLVMSMIPGLRYIRSIPTILAIMTCGASPRLFSHVEVHWQDDFEKEKRALKDYIQQELVMTLLRSKNRGHLCFW